MEFNNRYALTLICNFDLLGYRILESMLANLYMVAAWAVLWTSAYGKPVQVTSKAVGVGRIATMEEPSAYMEEVSITVPQVEQMKEGTYIYIPSTIQYIVLLGFLKQYLCKC